MTRVPRIVRLAMFCTIPLIAILIAGRQLYLHAREDLSTWKGGGMGMFADTDNLTRYLKIYLILGGDRREPLLHITQAQGQLEQRALRYPSESNFRALSDAIRATAWWAGKEQIPLNVFDSTGQKIRDGTEQYLDLYPDHSRTASEQADIDIEYWKAKHDPNPLALTGIAIEYWKASYDPKTMELTAALARTFTFKD
jgi:hypothetical protein